jgi:uncharacterized protein YjbJ (UPF0337 family)
MFILAPQPATESQATRCVSSPISTSEQSMNKDQLKGQFKQAKGQAKETTGRVFGNKTLENKGKVQNAAGKVQTSYGDVKADLKKEI